MGFTFFYTYQRKQKLTDAGQAFYEKAVRLLDNYNDLIQTTYTEEGIDKGHLRIGLSVAGGGALFSHIVPGFNASYPQITFSILKKRLTFSKRNCLRRILIWRISTFATLTEPKMKKTLKVTASLTRRTCW